MVRKETMYVDINRILDVRHLDCGYKTSYRDILVFNYPEEFEEAVLW